MDMDEYAKKTIEMVVDSNEEKFLKYLGDCCYNILKDQDKYGLTPPVLQLAKMLQDITTRMKAKGWKK